MKTLSHINEHGAAQMVDVAHKADQERIAIAMGSISLEKETVELIQNNCMKKGDVLKIAEFAGIQGAKQTATLIPLCHPLMLTNIQVEMKLHADGVTATASTKCIGKTGVEMEALTAVSVSLLTIYDMCKAVDKSMQITNIHLVSKTKN